MAAIRPFDDSTLSNWRGLVRISLLIGCLLPGVSACNKAKAPATVSPSPSLDEDESLVQGSKAQAQVEALIAKGNFADAVALADELSATHQKDPGLFYAKGAALSRLDKSSEAQVALKKAIAVDAKFVPAYVALAREIGFGSRDLSQALGYAQKAVEIDPKHAEASLVLAMIQHDSGDAPRAIATLEALSSKGVKDPAALIELSRLYAAKGEVAKARQSLEQAIKKLPGDKSVPARLLLGRIELSAGEEARAKQAFEGAMKAQPGNWDISLAVLRAYLSYQKPQAALPYAKAVVDAMPDQAPALVAMARVQLALGVIDGSSGATAWIEKASKLAPDSPAVQYAHAQILAGAGRCDAAKEVAAKLQGQLGPRRAQALAKALAGCGS